MSTLERTQVYLPTKLKKLLKRDARLRNGNFSQIVREYLEAQVKEHQNGGQKVNAAAKLLQGALQAEENSKKRKIKTPSDLSTNHDYYLYGDGRIE